jgi:hypothetical protein
MKNFTSIIFLLFSFLSGYSQTTRYVKQGGAGSLDGTSWANAASDLQEVINYSQAGDQIWVAAGTYYPSFMPQHCIPPYIKHSYNASENRARSFVIKPGVAIYGGFPNSGNPNFTDRDWEANATILSGDFNNNDSGTAASGFINNTENASIVVVSAANNRYGILNPTILDGFSIIGGNNKLLNAVWGELYTSDTTRNIVTGYIEQSPQLLSGLCASAIYLLDAQMTLRNLKIYNNTAPYAALGLYSNGSSYSYGSEITAENIIIENNCGNEILRVGGHSVLNANKLVLQVNNFFEVL